jgi:hypothetical protein
MNYCTFEIHHTNGEILADNLTFDDVPILFQAYQDWYGVDLVIACYRPNNKTFHPKNRADEFYEEWLGFIDYLITLDNI